ncbi:aminodeoxychorismate lyase [Lysobacter sp. H21R4]|uniref:aminodeoxychorismate lyase n=1 Tax=Lysobacter sp. H21R4 TaxID=2781021 RepID=UPI0018892135|nr:aminodeoxychorismate lyase [Lysobacter sp. H21R4]QOY62140.1 aminodeoxychorismate lyase [Lysobacter sp. H21R4]
MAESDTLIDAESAAARIFRGAVRIQHVPTDNRGLAYGDGLFETMRGAGGVLPWWERHWQRLQYGAERLQFPLPPEAPARAEAEQLLAGGDGVVKLLLTRGSGGRGYMPPPHAEPVWILSRHPLPPPATALVTVRWCRTRLSLQPALAGIKHCNRLEQVLARAEVGSGELDGDGDGDGDGDSDGAASEGLMRSTDGDVVCATAANVFVLNGDRWSTPLIDRCGVEGTMRAWLLEQVAVEQRRVSVEQVESANAVVLVNAVRGILQVGRLGDRSWAPHPAVSALCRTLASAHPAFTLPPSGPGPMELS